MFHKSCSHRGRAGSTLVKIIHTGLGASPNEQTQLGGEIQKAAGSEWRGPSQQPVMSEIDRRLLSAMLRYVIFCCEPRAQLLPSVAKCNKPFRRTTLLGRVLSPPDTVVSSLLRLLFPLPFFHPALSLVSIAYRLVRLDSGYTRSHRARGRGQVGWCTEGKSLDLQVQDKPLGIHRVTPPDSDRTCSVASGGKEYVRRWSSAARPISVTLALCCSIL